MEKKDKTKQWWRWLLFIPLGIVVFIIGYYVSTIFNWLGARFAFGFGWGFGFKFMQMSAEVAALAMSVFIAAHFSPNTKIGGIIYSAAMLAIGLVSLALFIIAAVNGYPNWWGIVTMVLYITELIILIIMASNGELEE